MSSPSDSQKTAATPSPTKALTADQILRADDAQFVAVPCPEWGGTVYVRMLTADERDRFEFRQSKLEEAAGTRANLLALAMCDENGQPMKVTEAQVQALGRKASAPMDRCFDATLALNRMRKVDREEATKN